MTAFSPPTLVASIGSIIKGRREAIEVALRRANGRTALDIRIHGIRGGDRVPTGRGLFVPLTDIRPMRRLLAEADAMAVSMGLLQEGDEQ